MKICPNCRTQYTDDSLRFCLQDGALLAAGPASQQASASLGGQEVETVTREADGSVETQLRHDRQVARPPAPAAKTRARWLVWAAAAGLLLIILVGAGSVGLWLYLQDRRVIVSNTDDRGGNQNGTSFNTNTNLVTPTRTPLPTPTPTATASTTPSNISSTVRDMQLSAEVSQQVESWGSSTESGDVNSLVSKYAPSVQYYRKSGATPDFIRVDKQRAYRTFDSISIRISNMDVNVSTTGETATASFDKEWVFGGARRSTGKVRQQLQFRKINGQWLITSERDVRIYYTN